MFLLLAIFLAVVGYATGGNTHIGDTPFSELTLNMLLSAAFSGGAYLAAIWAVFHSFDHDRIWPWRWSLPWLGNALLRLGVIAALVAFAAFFYQTKHLGDGALLLLVIGLAIAILYVLLTSELNYFKEANPKWMKNKPTVRLGRVQVGEVARGDASSSGTDNSNSP